MSIEVPRLVASLGELTRRFASAANERYGTLPGIRDSILTVRWSGCEQWSLVMTTLG